MAHGKFVIYLLPLAMLLGSCIPVDQLPPGAIPNMPAASGGTSAAGGAAYPDPEAGSPTVTSMHFTLKGYSQQDLEALKQTAEDLYNKIGNDTGLYTYLASGNFTLVEYKDHEDYLKNTHQPTWSHAVTAGKTIYFYPSPELVPELAHQMVHLIFDSYLGEKASNYRWLEEGLAMNEELAKMTESDRAAYLTSKSGQLRQNRMPFSQMTFFVTNTEEKRRTDSWYQQVESVVSFLLAQGSPLGFAQLLGELKTGTDIDRAMADSYQAKFKSLADLEAAWKYTI